MNKKRPLTKDEIIDLIHKWESEHGEDFVIDGPIELVMENDYCGWQPELRKAWKALTGYDDYEDYWEYLCHLEEDNMLPEDIDDIHEKMIDVLAEAIVKSNYDIVQDIIKNSAFDTSMMAYLRKKGFVQ